MKVLFLFLILVVGFLLFVIYLESKSVFYPAKNISHSPDEAGLPFEDVFIPIQGNCIHGWFISRPQHTKTVIFSHGNGGNIGDRLDKLYLFDRIGLNILIYDYQGYGKSTGNPSEKGLYQEAEAIYKYLTEERNIKPASIIVYGESLGGAVAVDLASKKDIGGLILDSTFSSARDMAKYIYPFIPGFLVRTKLDSLSKIRWVKAPKLFFHSKADGTVPYELAQKLYNAADGKKKFVEIQGGHNDNYEQSGETFYQEIKTFVNNLENR
ncbi:MAG: alpha/beta hydrolase [Candidatus Omnitrophica bacterium]|nr:alpha/beta hydrolase [Candidatus Omnitrophota bacterium]